MKKFFLVIAVLAAVVIVLGLVLLWTVRPKQQLDLAYERISVAGKIKDMIAARSLDLRLTESDLNNLMKRALAERNPPVPNVEIQGARFEQDGQIVTAHVQGKLYGVVSAEASLTFMLKWQSPNLIVEHVNTKAGPWNIPFSRFQLDPLIVPIDQELPSLVAIRDVKFEPSQIVISFKMR
jgi:hypothetical protein